MLYAQADMYQRHVLIHLQRRTSPNGLYLKQGDLIMRQENQIEIRHMTPDPVLENRLIQKIHLLVSLILGQLGETLREDLAHLRTRCRVDKV
jgi:hypothetical protein